MAVEPNDISLDAYNQKVTDWGSQTGNKIRTSIRSLTSKGKGDLLRSLRLKTGKLYGEVDKLSYHFLRHGIFVHKGVGRGYHMEAGRVVRGSKPSKKTSEKDLNVNFRLRQVILRSAGIKRKAVPWFNPVIGENIQSLADIVTEMNTDRVVNATKILIK